MTAPVMTAAHVEIARVLQELEAARAARAAEVGAPPAWRTLNEQADQVLTRLINIGRVYRGGYYVTALRRARHQLRLELRELERTRKAPGRPRDLLKARADDRLRALGVSYRRRRALLRCTGNEEA